MKKPVFFQNLLASSLSIVIGALALVACIEDDKQPTKTNPVNTKSYVIETPSWMDFSTNVEKTIEINLPDGQVSAMEFYIVQDYAGERSTYKLPGKGAGNQSFYNYTVDGSSDGKLLRIKIQRLSGPGEAYQGFGASVLLRPEPIIEK